MSHTHEGTENCTCRAPWLDRYDALRAEEEDMDDDSLDELPEREPTNSEGGYY